MPKDDFRSNGCVNGLLFSLLWAWLLYLCFSEESDRDRHSLASSRRSDFNGPIGLGENRENTTTNHWASTEERGNGKKRSRFRLWSFMSFNFGPEWNLDKEWTNHGRKVIVLSQVTGRNLAKSSALGSSPLKGQSVGWTSWMPMPDSSTICQAIMGTFRSCMFQNRNKWRHFKYSS